MNTYTLIITLIGIFLCNLNVSSQELLHRGALPHNFSDAVKQIQYDLIGNEKVKNDIKLVDDNTLHVKLSFF